MRRVTIQTVTADQCWDLADAAYARRDSELAAAAQRAGDGLNLLTSEDETRRGRDVAMCVAAINAEREA